MEESFKANIFDVEEVEGDQGASMSFADAVGAAHLKSDEERIVGVNGMNRRMEHYKVEEDGFFMNFVTFRYSGPGRVSDDSPISSFELREKDYFGYETSALYDPNHGLAFVESCRPGMTGSAIAQYYRGLLGKRAMFDFVPRLDPEASARARRMEEIRSLEMRVIANPVTSEDEDIGPISAVARGYEASYCTIKFGVEPVKGRSLRWEKIRNTLPRIMRAAENNDVQGLKVNGRRNEDEEFELINLLQHREQRTFMLEVHQHDRKIPHEIRWDALNDIRRDFVRNLINDQTS